MIEIAVGILTLQAIVINRLAGIDYPAWAQRQADAALISHGSSDSSPAIGGAPGAGWMASIRVPG